VQVVDTLKRELQQRRNMPLLFTTPKLNEGGTELENFLGCDFYKYVAPDGAWFVPCLTQPPPV